MFYPLRVQSRKVINAKNPVQQIYVFKELFVFDAVNGVFPFVAICSVVSIELV
jgi:hypothetical protein